ncbi:MAG: hypothetical protein HQ581_28745 [Planctomycetes bacterium]|nr:hypothetical protein [Planctomycetota bacterium]
MVEQEGRPRILVVDDEGEWRAKLAAIVAEHSASDTVILKSFEEADRYVTSDAVKSLDAAIVDVRLRQQVYDQGGLTILNLLKEQDRELPILILTAYSYDYPGLREIANRYPSVLAYDKEVFEREPNRILDILLADLPPQIGTHVPKGRNRHSEPVALPRPVHRHTAVWRELVVGTFVVLFVLAAAFLFFIMSGSFAEHSAQLNIVFAVVVVAVICVLLRIFSPGIVQHAVNIFRELAGQKSRAPEPDETESQDTGTNGNKE